MGARIRARLAGEEGQTLIEMITTMAMLSFVMAAVAALFVSGLHAQTDMPRVGCSRSKIVSRSRRCGATSATRA